MTNKQVTVVIAEVACGQHLHLLPGAVKFLVVCSPSVCVLCMGLSSCEGIEVLQHNCVLSESVNFAVC